MAEFEIYREYVDKSYEPQKDDIVAVFRITPAEASLLRTPPALLRRRAARGLGHPFIHGMMRKGLRGFQQRLTISWIWVMVAA